jgi:phosphonate metabolism protein PhnN/1,5-bisphosphokinase (PRPP-forming)
MNQASGHDGGDDLRARHGVRVDQDEVGTPAERDAPAIAQPGCRSGKGLRYGIPASIEPELRAGRTVVCNASRTIVDGARARYRHVKVVLVTAPPDVLEARLTRRARSSDGAVTERLQRAVSADRDVDPDIIIDNIGAIESGVRRLLNAIHDQTSFVAF